MRRNEKEWTHDTLIQSSMMTMNGVREANSKKIIRYFCVWYRMFAIKCFGFYKSYFISYRTHHSFFFTKLVIRFKPKKNRCRQTPNIMLYRKKKRNGLEIPADRSKNDVHDRKWYLVNEQRLFFESFAHLSMVYDKSHTLSLWQSSHRFKSYDCALAIVGWMMCLIALVMRCIQPSFGCLNKFGAMILTAFTLLCIWNTLDHSVRIALSDTVWWLCACVQACRSHLILPFDMTVRL